MRTFPDSAFSASSFFLRINSAIARWMASVFVLAPVTFISSLMRPSSRRMVVRIQSTSFLCFYYMPCREAVNRHGEATVQLAPVVMRDVLETLAALKGRCAMLVVEQNRTVLERLADRVLVMRSGH